MNNHHDSTRDIHDQLALGLYYLEGALQELLSTQAALAEQQQHMSARLRTVEGQHGASHDEPRLPYRDGSTVSNLVLHTHTIPPTLALAQAVLLAPDLDAARLAARAFLHATHQPLLIVLPDEVRDDVPALTTPERSH